MTKWIKADWDFGLPYATFTVGARQVQIMRAQGILPAYDTNTHFPEKAEQWEQMAEKVLLHFRPELKGAVVCGLGFSFGSMYWEISVTHPSLSRLCNGSFPHRGRIEKCPACGRSLPDHGTFRGLVSPCEEMTDPGEAVVDCDFHWGRNDVVRREVECCSMECLEKVVKEGDGCPVHYEDLRSNLTEDPLPIVHEPDKPH